LSIDVNGQCNKDFRPQYEKCYDEFSQLEPICDRLRIECANWEGEIGRLRITNAQLEETINTRDLEIVRLGKRNGELEQTLIVKDGTIN
jgi:predicted nuclease with TOPRIM domain